MGGQYGKSAALDQRYVAGQFVRKLDAFVSENGGVPEFLWNLPRLGPRTDRDVLDYRSRVEIQDSTTDHLPCRDARQVQRFSQLNASVRRRGQAPLQWARSTGWGIDKKNGKLANKNVILHGQSGVGKTRFILDIIKYRKIKPFPKSIVYMYMCGWAGPGGAKRIQ